MAIEDLLIGVFGPRAALRGAVVMASVSAVGLAVALGLLALVGLSG